MCSVQDYTEEQYFVIPLSMYMDWGEKVLRVKLGNYSNYTTKRTVMFTIEIHHKFNKNKHTFYTKF